MPFWQAAETQDLSTFMKMMQSDERFEFVPTAILVRSNASDICKLGHTTVSYNKTCFTIFPTIFIKCKVNDQHKIP